jgi:hypothetical protein
MRHRIGLGGSRRGITVLQLVLLILVVVIAAVLLGRSL